MALYGEYDEDLERAEAYALFARILMEPPVADELVRMKEIFQMEFSDTENEVRKDFQQLFSKGATHLPSCESLYHYPVGDKARLWGKATMDVEGFYNSVGLMIDAEVELIPDHIAAELLFMSYLVEKGLEEVQLRFLHEHLLQWVPAFSEELRNHATTMFYKEVADLLRNSLQEHHDELAGTS